jgi:hypothetical protein
LGESFICKEMNSEKNLAGILENKILLFQRLKLRPNLKPKKDRVFRIKDSKKLNDRGSLSGALPETFFISIFKAPF